MKLAGLAAMLLSCALCTAAGAARAADATPVKVYDPGELALDRYTVVQRLWTGTWRTAFWVSRYDEVEEAVQALTSKAADLGADGITNLHCVNDSGSHLCYALAIKFKERWTSAVPTGTPASGR